MFLRALVANYVRQTVQKTLMETVSAAAQGGTQSLEGDEPDAASQVPFSVALIFGSSVESGGTLDGLTDVRTVRLGEMVFHAGWQDGVRVLLAESGLGADAARATTEEVIRRFSPQWVISAGFATALSPELRRGAILMPDRLADVSSDELSIPLTYDPNATPQQRGFHVGKLVSSDRELRTLADKSQLRETTRAVAADVETLEIARCCQRNQVRFMAIRVISETLSDELPADIGRAIQQKSMAGRLGAMTGAILNRLSSVKDMWQLREDALVVSDRLAKFLGAVIARVGERHERPAAET